MHIETTEDALLCESDDKLTAFVELERQVLTVTFYLRPLMPNARATFVTVHCS